MDFFDVLDKRQSIRKFKEKEVEEEKIEKLLNAINSAPSAGDLQAYEVFLVKNKEKKEALANAALGQDFIAVAPLVLVFFANPERSAAKYGARGEGLYCILDVAIAAAYCQLTAVALDLGTVWVGAFDSEEVKRIAGAKAEWTAVAIIPVGCPDEKPWKTPRRDIKDLAKTVE